MAANLPISGSPIEVSTDVVDAGDGSGAGHVQRLKILDGRNAGTHPLAVEENGALRAPLALITFAGFVTPGEAGGYTSGDLVGPAADLGTYPNGALRSLSITIASLAGLVLPDLDVFIVQVPAATDPGDLGDDADPLVLGAFASGILGSNAAGFAPTDAEPRLLRWRSDHLALVSDNFSSDPARWLLAFRAGETFADDLTAGLVAFGFAEYVAPVAVASGP